MGFHSKACFLVPQNGIRNVKCLFRPINDRRFYNWKEYETNPLSQVCEILVSLTFDKYLQDDVQSINIHRTCENKGILVIFFALSLLLEEFKQQLQGTKCYEAVWRFARPQNKIKNSVWMGNHLLRVGLKFELKKGSQILGYIQFLYVSAVNNIKIL